MSGISTNRISAGGSKTIEEMKEILQSMTNEELAALTLLLNYQKRSRQHKRNRQLKES